MCSTERIISRAAQIIRNGLTRDVLDETPVPVKRRLWEDSTRVHPTPLGTRVLSVEHGGVPCLLCIPDQQTSERTIVYCHGGGLVEGSVETHRVWTCRLALHTGCRVLSVEYRLVPEHPYPAAVSDVISVCSALVCNTDFSGGFCIGADSTGCILAILALLKFKSHGEHKPNCAFLLSPSIDLTFSGDSIRVNASEDPVVSLDVLRHYADLYADGKDKRDPDISPLFSDFHEISPILLFADKQEILLDDATRLKQKIMEAGGIAKLYLAQGLWHVWPVCENIPESTLALNLIKQHIENPDAPTS